MTIIPTPSGMVEPGADNTRPPVCAKIEVGNVFEGNAPVSTPTPAANIKESNPGGNQ